MGHQASRLGHFSTIFENKVLVDFFDFGSFDMLDDAYYGSTNCFELNFSETFRIGRKYCEKASLKVLEIFGLKDIFFTMGP